MHRQFLFICLFLGLIPCLFGQKIDMEHLEGLSMRNVGPAGMSGRVTAIDVDLRNPERIYVGTASGGVWLSEDGGITWAPIFDGQPILSIGSVKINQANPAEIWVGTGEGNPRNSHNSGAGIYKSRDGGKTWKLMGLERTKVIHRIAISTLDSEVVYAGGTGSAWGPTKDRGVYKTDDGGKTWEQVLFVNERTGVADMVMDPSNPNKFLVAMWEHGRTPWDFTSGGPGSGLYLTYDGGENWKKLTHKEGMPKGELGRIGMAIAPSKPNIIYALIEAKKNGLYKSTDGGESWNLVSTKNIGNRPFYYSELYVDPSNENRIWNLWSYVSKSEDGGKTFRTILDYGKGVHPDHHAFWIHPNDPKYLIDGNDGGVNISRDGGKNWRFVTNLPVGQFYHVNIDMDYPYNIYGGMQDNGSWIGPAYVLKNGGIRNADWREVYFGDGFDIMPRQDDNRYGWAMSQGGNLSYYDKETGYNQLVKPVHPEGVRLRFNWNAALAQDPFSDCGIYYGSQFVHKSLDCGKSWEIISPDLTTNDTAKQNQAASGGLTIDATQAENHTTILAIAPSPFDKDVLWVSTDDGRLQLTRDGGKHWTDLSNALPGCPAGSYMPQVEVSPHKEEEAFVIVNNYRRNDWRPYLYHTTDYGDSWVSLVSPEQVHGHTLAIVQDLEEPNLLFLGTDRGLYVSLDKGRQWNKWSDKSYPSVSTRDLKIHPREHDLVIGTFGRAFWVLDDIRPLRAIARSAGKVLDKTLATFDSPDAYLASYRSVDGIRFTADAEFLGKNRRRGAKFTVWLRPEAKKMGQENPGEKNRKKKKQNAEAIDTGERIAHEANKKEKSDKKKLQVYVLNSGDTIRNFSRKLKPGMNELSWDLRKDGVRFPSRNEVKKDADPPSGIQVLPGEYKLVMTYGAEKDSTIIQVLPDPRIPISKLDIAAHREAMDKYEGLVAQAATAFVQLNQVKKTMKLVESASVNLPDSTRKKIKERGKEIHESVDDLMEIYMLPENTKGILGATPNLNRTLYRARSYLNSSLGKPGDNAMTAFRLAKDEVSKAVGEINAFLQEDWQSYREEMEAIEMPLFKNLKQVDVR